MNEGANLVTSIVPSLPPLQITSNVVLSNGTSGAGVGDGKPIELGAGTHGNSGNSPVLPLKTTTMVSSPTELKKQKCMIL